MTAGSLFSVSDGQPRAFGTTKAVCFGFLGSTLYTAYTLYNIPRHRGKPMYMLSTSFPIADTFCFKSINS